MSDQVKIDGRLLGAAPQWREMRDDSGRLYARIDPRLLLLEVRRNQESRIFDLRDYLELHCALEIDADIE